MEIKTFSPTSHKIKAVIYGKSGAGKTYFSATAPKPIFASAEGGLLATLKHKKAIDPIKYVEIKKIEDLRDLLNFLKDGTKHDYKTVIIDSITEINEIIKDGIEKKRGAQMQLKDWGDLAKAIKNILRGFRDLDMHVIFIAQQKEEKDGDTVTAFVPSLNGKAANEIAYFMDIVAYAYVDKTGQNHITTQPHEKYVTKSRGIEFEGDAPDDFEEWIKAMSEIKLKKEEVETVTTEAPKPPVAPAKADPKALIKPETSKAMFAEWTKYYAASGKPAKEEVAHLKATIKKEFGVDSSRALTEVQASGFVERLRNHNKKAATEKKAANKKAKSDKATKPEVGETKMTEEELSEKVQSGEISPEGAEIMRDNEEVAQDDSEAEQKDQAEQEQAEEKDLQSTQEEGNIEQQ